MTEQTTNTHTAETKNRPPVQAPQRTMGETLREQVALEQGYVHRALARPSVARPIAVLAPHHLLGNRAVNRLCNKPAALKAGPPAAFAFEPSGLLQRKCDCGQPIAEGDECAECHQKRAGTLQRKCACGENAGSGDECE